MHRHKPRPPTPPRRRQADPFATPPRARHPASPIHLAGSSRHGRRNASDSAVTALEGATNSPGQQQLTRTPSLPTDLLLDNVETHGNTTMDQVNQAGPRDTRNRSSKIRFADEISSQTLDANETLSQDPDAIENQGSAKGKHPNRPSVASNLSRITTNEMTAFDFGFPSQQEGNFVPPVLAGPSEPFTNQKAASSRVPGTPERAGPSTAVQERPEFRLLTREVTTTSSQPLAHELSATTTRVLPGTPPLHLKGKEGLELGQTFPTDTAHLTPLIVKEVDKIYVPESYYRPLVGSRVDVMPPEEAKPRYLVNWYVKGTRFYNGGLLLGNGKPYYRVGRSRGVRAPGDTGCVIV